MTRWERYLKDSMLDITLVIEDAIDELTGTECPHCYRPTCTPTFEEIQEWLEKEENGS